MAVPVPAECVCSQHIKNDCTSDNFAYLSVILAWNLLLKPRDFCCFFHLCMTISVWYTVSGMAHFVIKSIMTAIISRAESVLGCSKPVAADDRHLRCYIKATLDWLMYICCTDVFIFLYAVTTQPTWTHSVVQLSTRRITSLKWDAQDSVLCDWPLYLWAALVWVEWHLPVHMLQIRTCTNTMGSFICNCNPGFYEISSARYKATCQSKFFRCVHIQTTLLCGTHV